MISTCTVNNTDIYLFMYLCRLPPYSAAAELSTGPVAERDNMASGDQTVIGQEVRLGQTELN